MYSLHPIFNIYKKSKYFEIQVCPQYIRYRRSTSKLRRREGILPNLKTSRLTDSYQIQHSHNLERLEEHYFLNLANHKNLHNLQTEIIPTYFLKKLLSLQCNLSTLFKA